MKPFFSIIIPTLNEEKYLPRLLQDFCKQKEKNFEVIVVDGQSKDKTKQVAEKFKDDLNLTFIENPRKNVSYQRNFGARIAKGDYLVFLDADSGVNSSFTKNLQKIILKRKGLVFIPYIIADERSAQTKVVFRLTNLLVEFSHSLGRPFSAGGNMIWEKNFFHTVGGFDETLYLAEDHNIIQRAYQWGVKTRFLHQIKVKFSLRRMRREGQLAVFYKYLIGSAYFLLKGDIREKIFDYKMGGGVKDDLKRQNLLENNLRLYINQIKRFFRHYLS